MAGKLVGTVAKDPRWLDLGGIQISLYIGLVLLPTYKHTKDSLGPRIDMKKQKSKEL